MLSWVEHEKTFITPGRPSPESVPIILKLSEYFDVYYQRKFHAQLSWAWKRFYNLGPVLTVSTPPPSSPPPPPPPPSPPPPSLKVYQFPIILSLPNFRRHLSSAFFLNKLMLGKKFIRKAERLNVKQRRSRWDGSLWAVSSGSMLFAKAYYYRLWQWKS